MAGKPLTFRVAFSTPWFAIEESVPDEAGQAPFYRMTGPNGVICMPFTPEGDVVMVRQFRPAIGTVTMEMPAGGIEPNETVEEAAFREIAEETGHRPSSVALLGPGRLHLNRNTHQEFFLLAFDAVPCPDAAVEPGLEPFTVTRSELRDLICADRIEQIAALTFLGLASAKLGIHLLSDPIDIIRSKLRDAPRKESYAG